jgi:collagenase-like PrtC family protease
VLAPAGGWAQLRAAVANGADAVYFGCSDGFNARARAANFDAETELPAVMKFLHENGVHGYMTLNTLVFEDELKACEALIRRAAAAGVDALIMQDVGAARLAAATAPSLHIHASTQMSVTDAAGARFASLHAGARRVVMARELSIAELSAVESTMATSTEESTMNHNHSLLPVEVEAFVHGALCVSYSGQCFSSEAWGGRSANRGECAQGCRLEYGLIADGELKEMGDERYLLSPQDLCGIDHVEQLVDAGVSCFKIEGRLKGPEYVAATTRHYRLATDRAWASREARQQEKAKGKDKEFFFSTAEATSNAKAREELALVFARAQDGEYDGYQL